ncbi:hypothetical protein EK21DRAFT_54826 [Setomelanomma holmii]|uniref:Uncharacterized protein n=1 Tax=Setomelanomma holmii TaxID=210430 RepID=A0A9P4HHC7_9PLEO|nr:hypothetical protein EK21DRAFT_54826 [Setomelanomma holmii]
MEGPPRYQPLSRDEEEAIQAQLAEKDETAWNAKDTEIIPTNTRSFVIYLSIILLSLSANILLVMDNAKLRIARNSVKTAFSGLTFDTPTAYHGASEFWNLNATAAEMNAAWDAIDTNPVAVALDDKYAAKRGLPPTTRFPWDTERSVYYLKGIHDLHCLKLIRKAIVSKHDNDIQTFNLHHMFHCLDGLRQDIMCMADDTPMPSPKDHTVGDGQVRRCRNWDQMIDWALEPERHACYGWDDYREATNTLELFAYCPPTSPYYAFQQAYFEYHGHKDTYEVKEGSDPVVVF